MGEQLSQGRRVWNTGKNHNLSPPIFEHAITYETQTRENKKKKNSIYIDRDLPETTDAWKDAHVARESRRGKEEQRTIPKLYRHIILIYKM